MQSLRSRGRGNPVPLDVFCTYGMEFQNKSVPELERVRVIRLRDPEMKGLLTDTNRWALSARLAMNFAEMGCEVAAICPTPGHALSKVNTVQQLFRYSGLRPYASVFRLGRRRLPGRARIWEQGGRG